MYRMMLHNIAGQPLMPFCECCCLSVHNDIFPSHNVTALPSDIVVVIFCVVIFIVLN